MRTGFQAILMAGVMVSPAAADVMVVRSMDMDGFGGFGGSKRHMTTWTAADRQREESKSEGKPSMMEKMSGVGRPVITRLDKKLRWTLNEPKKTYEESPLVVPQKEEAAKPEANEPEDKAEEKPTMKITKADVKVTALGQKKKIGEFNCEGYEMRTILEMEDLETHKRTEMRMVTTLWNTPEQGAVAQLKKEETAYALAYAKVLGLTDTVRADLKTMGALLVSSMAGAGEKELSGALSKLPAEMKKIKGYPIQTRVEWYGNDEEEAAEGDSAEDTAEIPTNVSDALGGFAAGFAKKKMEAKRPAPTQDGRLMLAMTTEVKSISPAPIPGATFDIPAGFKKGH